MIWRSTYSRDYEEAVANGFVDDDLDRMRDLIAERIEERDGTKRCPQCGELLRVDHLHDGIWYVQADLDEDNDEASEGSSSGIIGEK